MRVCVGVCGWIVAACVVDVVVGGWGLVGITYNNGRASGNDMSHKMWLPTEASAVILMRLVSE